MRVEELRIGDLVNATRCDSSEIVDKVSKLFSIDDMEIIETSKGWNKIKPIPLTEDILLDCGFNKCLNKYKLNTKLHTRNTENVPFIILDLDGFEYDDLRFQTKLKHVHQLQNLYFSLTGQELEFKTLGK